MMLKKKVWYSNDEQNVCSWKFKKAELRTDSYFCIINKE